MLPSDRVNANFRNYYMDKITDVDEGLYVEDDELLSIVLKIISKDEVFRSILNMVDDDRAGKKAKVARFVYSRKTREEFWDTAWGKTYLLLVVVMILLVVGGVNPYSRAQAEFRADFRVPFTLFKEIIVECKEAFSMGLDIM